MLGRNQRFTFDITANSCMFGPQSYLYHKAVNVNLDKVSVEGEILVPRISHENCNMLELDAGVECALRGENELHLGGF